MDAKEYLSQIYKIHKRIEHMQFMKDEYDRLASSAGGPCYDKPYVDKTRSLEAPFLKWLDKSLQMEEKIKEEVLKEQMLIDEAMKKIQKIENMDFVKVLTLRYIRFLKWSEIADELYYSMRNVFRAHNKALKEFESINKVGS